MDTLVSVLAGDRVPISAEERDMLARIRHPTLDDLAAGRASHAATELLATTAEDRELGALPAVQLRAADLTADERDHLAALIT